ncbi:MAG: efflux RND transporter periplasmic adaptor subunit [Caulobacteraceae bacterium]
MIQPTGGAGDQALTLPGQIQAFYDAPIHARVSGYLKRWYADIGTPVKSGQILAEIDTPRPRPAARPGQGRPRHRHRQPAARPDHRQALERPAHPGRGLPAGGRREERRPQGQGLAGQRRARQRRPAGGAGVVQADHRPVRRGGHQPLHRHRRP